MDSIDTVITVLFVLIVGPPIVVWTLHHLDNVFFKKFKNRRRK